MSNQTIPDIPGIKPIAEVHQRLDDLLIKTRDLKKQTEQVQSDVGELYDLLFPKKIEPPVEI